MEYDGDRELLTMACKTANFFGSVLDDSLGDWELAKGIGEIFLRVDRRDINGAFLLARECRHLGDLKLAFENLEPCKAIITDGKTSIDQEVMGPAIANEERLLRSLR
jgi:hypothetical protein